MKDVKTLNSDILEWVQTAELHLTKDEEGGLRIALSVVRALLRYERYEIDRQSLLRVKSKERWGNKKSTIPAVNRY